ncbi:MAG: hypothetical protein ACRC7G_13430, partial [Beijerinckiaceae bacterium]
MPSSTSCSRFFLACFLAPPLLAGNAAFANDNAGQPGGVSRFVVIGSAKQKSFLPVERSSAEVEDDDMTPLKPEGTKKAQPEQPKSAVKAPAAPALAQVPAPKHTNP